MPLTHATVERAAREVLEIATGLKVPTASHHHEDDSATADVVATLVLVGARSGTLVVYSTWAQALQITTGMLGASEQGYDEDTMRDALGELTNQIAGTIKRAVAASGSDMALSPPVVTNGSELPSDVRTTALPVRVDFEIGGDTLRICLWAKTGQPHSAATGELAC